MKNKSEQKSAIKDETIFLGALQEIWYHGEGHQKVKINDILYVTWIEWSELPTLRVGSNIKYILVSKGPTTIQYATNRQVQEDCIKIISVV
jgi:hypothetical protein